MTWAPLPARVPLNELELRRARLIVPGRSLDEPGRRAVAEGEAHHVLLILDVSIAGQENVDLPTCGREQLTVAKAYPRRVMD